MLFLFKHFLEFSFGMGYFLKLKQQKHYHIKDNVPGLSWKSPKTSVTLEQKNSHIAFLQIWSFEFHSFVVEHYTVWKLQSHFEQTIILILGAERLIDFSPDQELQSNTFFFHVV